MRNRIPAFFLLLTFLFLVGIFAADVVEVEFQSPSLGIAKKMMVVLPAGYKADAAAAYPVAYFLDGYAGSHARWVKETPLVEMADKYGIIAVCPNGTKNSWYFDSPVRPENKYESFIFKDVVGYVDQHYKTRAVPAGRAITGLSMGGHGAMFVGLRHPEVFGAVAAMSGGLDIRPFPDKWNIKDWLGDIKTHPENWESGTVFNVVDGVKPGVQRILFDCGKSDFFLGVNRKTHEKMVKLGIPHLYEEYPGAHNWAYWKPAVKRHMAFFDAFFRGDAPAVAASANDKPAEPSAKAYAKTVK